MTIENLHKLKSKGFDGLYTSKQTKWKALAKHAVTFAKAYVSNNEKITPAEVAQALELSLKIDTDFENQMTTKKLTQRFWVPLFAEYIVEQIYPPADVK